MNVVFSKLPATLSPAHEACWKGFRTLFFADPRRTGRRKPNVLGKNGKPVTGPWREDVYRERTKSTVVVWQDASPNIIAMHLGGVLYDGRDSVWLQCYAASEEGHAVYTTVDLDVEGENHSAAAEHFATQESAREAALKLIAEAEALGLTPHLEVTKSGGYRVWVFHHRVQAAHAQGLGRLLVLRAKLHAKTEVFPAQAFLNEGQVGSAVFVPYNAHNAKLGRQVMIDPVTGTIRMVEDFVADALAGRSDSALVAKIVSEATESGELKASEPPRERPVYDGDNLLAQDPRRSAAAWAYTLTRCPALAQIVQQCDEGAEIGYHDWLRLATHLRPYGELGYGEFHSLSASDPRYDERQADDVWNSLSGGATCCNKMECGYDPDLDCGLPQGRVSALAFGYEMLRKLPLVKTRKT